MAFAKLMELIQLRRKLEVHHQRNQFRQI